MIGISNNLLEDQIYTNHNFEPPPPSHAVLAVSSYPLFGIYFAPVTRIFSRNLFSTYIDLLDTIHLSATKPLM